MFFIVINKFCRGFSTLKFCYGYKKALSHVATKGHLKHIFFSIMFKEPLKAFAVVTSSVSVYSFLLTGQGFLKKFLTSSLGILWKSVSSTYDKWIFFYFKRAVTVAILTDSSLSAPNLFHIFWNAVL